MTETDRLDERELRTPEWTPGFPVELADGQAWTFPRIKLCSIEPERDPAGGFRASWGYTANGRELPDYERWTDVLLGVERVPDRVYWDIRVNAAATLLSLNYHLTDAELAYLLRYQVDHAKPPERTEDGPYTLRWRQIDRAALGELPKPSPATDASPTP